MFDNRLNEILSFEHRENFLDIVIEKDPKEFYLSRYNYFWLLICKDRILNKFKCYRCKSFLEIQFEPIRKPIKIDRFKLFAVTKIPQDVVPVKLLLKCKCRQKNKEMAKRYRFVGSHDKTFGFTYGVGKKVRELFLKLGGKRPSKTDLKMLWIKQKGKCFYCGKVLAESYDRTVFHVGHFFPVTFGGTNSMENLRLSCPKYNLDKSYLTNFQGKESDQRNWSKRCTWAKKVNGEIQFFERFFPCA